MTNVTGISVYDNMKNWQIQHEANDVATLKLLSQKDELGLSEDEIFAEYFNQQDEIGYEFNFMEGNNPNDVKAYNQQLQKLGEGEVAFMDLDGDGEVSREEYLNEELKGLTEDDSLDTKAHAYTMATLMFDIIDKGMGNSDSSDSLSADEFESFYKNLDQFQLDENYDGVLTGEFDGKFDIDSASEFIPYLIDNTISQDTYNDLFDQYKDVLSK